MAACKFLVPADPWATDARPRTLGLAFIRPATYRRRHADGGGPPGADAGLLAFNRDLQRQLAALKARRSEGCKLIDDAPLPWVPLYSLLLKVMPGGMEELTGTVLRTPPRRSSRRSTTTTGTGTSRSARSTCRPTTAGRSYT